MRLTVLQAALCSFVSPPLLFRQPWLQAGACAFSGLRTVRCVQLIPGCTQDHRALPLSHNSPQPAWGVGREEIKKCGASTVPEGGCREDDILS